MKIRQSGKKDSSAIVEELCRFSPSRGTGIKKGRKSLKLSRQSGLSNDQALAIRIDANLSTHRYDFIRKKTKEINKGIHPPNHEVKAAKLLCFPREMDVTETKVKQPL
ncbi:hypothetical protein JTB14_025626 [Gonioctena quinquepunctata]|nr:hypothetical protein JTB14_025626 [Gonioctena quinquepunctata]